MKFLFMNFRGLGSWREEARWWAHAVVAKTVQHIPITVLTTMFAPFRDEDLLELDW